MKIQPVNICNNVTLSKRAFRNRICGFGCLTILFCTLYYAGITYADTNHNAGQPVNSAGVKTHLPNKAYVATDTKNAIETVTKQNTAYEHDNDSDILSKLVVPMGITTISLVIITVFLSLFRRVNVRPMMKWHKRSGIATLIVAVAHAILALIAH